MTEVILTRDDRELTVRLCVRGHAGYAPAGRDIVCSAVSILACTAAALALSYKDEGAEAYVSMEDGDAAVEIAWEDPADYERCQEQMRAVEVGYRLLAKRYPEYVTMR